jgi:hypothetical protein
MLDASQFPSASAYLRSLPAAWDSFPGCRVRALVFEHIGKQHSDLAQAAPDGPLRQLLKKRVESNEWVPEVVGQVANLMVRDRYFASDEAYCEWTYEMSLNSFGKPLLRQLMRLMSPSLLVLGAAKRWSALHVGSELSTSAVRNLGERLEVTGHLQFPEGVFPELFLVGLCPAFRAAMSLSRGRDVTVTLAARKPSSADYVVNWAA